MSIRTKLSTLILSLLLAFVLYIAFYSMPHLRQKAESMVLNEIQAHLMTASEAILPFLLQGQLANIYETLDALEHANDNWLVIKLVNSQGQQLYPLDPIDTPVSNERAIVLDQSVGFVYPNHAELVVAIDRISLSKLGNELAIEIGLGILALACSFFLCIYMSFKYLIDSRLNKLLLVSDEIASGNYKIKIDKKSNDELGNLESSFNLMGEKISAITDQLTQKNEALKEAQKLSKIGSWQWHIDKELVSFSKESLNILAAFKPGEWVRLKDIRRNFTTEQIIQFQGMLEELLTGRAINEIFRVETRSGQEICLRLRAQQDHRDSLRFTKVVGTLQDVTAELEAQKAKEERQRVYAQIFYKDPTIKLLIDPNDGQIVDANPAALNFYGYSEERIKEIKIYDINKMSVAECRAGMALVTSEKQCKFQFQHHLSSGEIRDVEIHSCPVSLEGKTYLHSSIFDVTERNQLQQRLEDAALHDPLTSLWNRRAIDTQGEREFLLSKRNNTHLCLLMIDLDHFKAINDQYGHPIGDLVLKQAAEVILGVVRETDLVGRYGGEEFVVLAPNTNLDGGSLLAEKILEAIRAMSVVVQGSTIRVTTSIGVSSVIATDLNFYQLVERSDKHLYTAKEAGRDRSSSA
ncbi:diguanylate cyclase [Motiliproteus coralliicola]|uniref:diguanylate cyclase n=1 Tax=Motiliproteus coralliicola TaxID=2283196 RepID=A0A369WDR2_9GAMM|nr:diguanylate cyclase [Motiliproteus coralliicola]RDE19433.1 diguanylate cyclase [Motiliproteus coralliicola]